MDTGLAAHLMNLNLETLTKDRYTLGALLESFVVSELIKQQSQSTTQGNLYHYRVHSGSEVDVVFEDRQGRLLGIEVKATATPRNDDFKGLRAFQHDTAQRFYQGVVLHTGTHTLPFGDKLWAMPLSRLWR
jgi:predicted AAA+ superfamily ATPase